MPGVYQWKHGWIPLTHAAAMSKAKGNKKIAAKMVPPGDGKAASSPKAGNGNPPPPPARPSSMLRVDVKAAQDRLDHVEEDFPGNAGVRNEAIRKLDKAQAALALAEAYEKYHASQPAPSKENAIAELKRQQARVDEDEKIWEAADLGRAKKEEALRQEGAAHAAYIGARKAGLSAPEITRRIAPDIRYGQLHMAEVVVSAWLRSHKAGR